MPRFILPRRTVLRGAIGGAAVQVALPPLAAMLNGNGTALAQGQPLPKRFGVFFWGNGVKPRQWVPAATGKDWALSEELAPLAKVKPYLNVVTGTAIKFPNAAHHAGQVGVLCGGQEIKGKTGNTFPKPSIDQLAAAALGKTTRFKSLEVGVLRRNQGGEGVSILYVSHNGPDSPNPPERDPAKVFERLFGADFKPPMAGTTGTPMPVADVSVKLRRSLLDAVLTDIGSLKQRVGAADVRRLDQHTENIRGIEKRLVDVPVAVASAQCRRPTMPASSTATSTEAQYAAVNKAMSELVAMALACDQTRVFSYQFSGGGNHDRYPGLGAGDHHTLNHEEPGDQPISHKIAVFVMQQLAVFLETLQAMPEGAGNLLDQCSIVCTSELSDGKSHSISDYPILIAGRAGGGLQYPGIHYRSATKESSSIPTLSALRAAGVPLKSFGDAGALTEMGLSAIEAG